MGLPTIEAPRSEASAGRGPHTIVTFDPGILLSAPRTEILTCPPTQKRRLRPNETAKKEQGETGRQASGIGPGWDAHRGAATKETGGDFSRQGNQGPGLGLEGADRLRHSRRWNDRGL